MKTLEAAVRPSIAHEKFKFQKLHSETFHRCSLWHGLRYDRVRLVSVVWILARYVSLIEEDVRFYSCFSDFFNGIKAGLRRFLSDKLMKLNDEMN